RIKPHQTSTKLLSSHPQIDTFVFFDGKYKDRLSAPTLSIVTRDTESTRNQRESYILSELAGNVHNDKLDLDWESDAPAPELKVGLSIDNAIFSSQSLILSSRNIFYQYKSANSDNKEQQVSTGHLEAIGISWRELIHPLEQCTNWRGLDTSSSFKSALLGVPANKSDTRVQCLSRVLNKIMDSSLASANEIIPIYGHGQQEILGWYDRFERVFVPKGKRLNEVMNYLGVTSDQQYLFFSPKDSILYKTDMDGGTVVIAEAVDVTLNKETLIYAATDYRDTIKPLGTSAHNLILTGRNGTDTYLFTPESMRDKNIVSILNHATDGKIDTLDLTAFSADDFTVFTHKQDLVLHYSREKAHDFYIIVKNQLSGTKQLEQWQHIKVRFGNPYSTYWLKDIAKSIQSSNRYQKMNIESGMLFLYSGQGFPVYTVDTTIDNVTPPLVLVCGDGRKNC
uniref:hypothetical protein n=1 Tax=Moritella viscosa TaxID=80854 RepID=UPI000ADCEDC4